MKVRELIEELKKHDPEMEVAHMDDGLWAQVTVVEALSDVLVMGLDMPYPGKKFPTVVTLDCR